MKIFEAVPNISEARDQKKIKILLAVIRQTPQVLLLDYSSDVDHNRSVFTYLGSRQGVLAASFALVKKAQEILNITEHQGVHPRIGVVDVLPIIPLLDSSMTEAVALSHELGTKIEEKLKIPVYYYENSVKEERFRNLANIRREKYNIRVHPQFGSICIGARGFLVAYNINLETKNLAVAKKIAAEIREANGGLQHLKAIGLYLAEKGCTQVSMNLTNPEVTDTKKVYAAVADIVKKYDVTIKEEELIGLLPTAVLAAAEKIKEELKIKKCQKE